MRRFPAILVFLAASFSVVGCSHAHVQPMYPLDSSLERKRITEAYLNTLGIPINPHLPSIEGENKVRLREPKEVAKRAAVLYALVAVAHGVDRRRTSEWLRKEGLWESVSPKEKEFFDSEKPSDQNRIDVSWRAESLWALLWAMGKIEKLDLPNAECDTQLIQDVMPEPETMVAHFVNQATLRPPSEILDAMDLTYRIDWAVVDARMNRREAPGGVNPGIVYERHYALNWLTWYADGWDDITTDT